MKDGSSDICSIIEKDEFFKSFLHEKKQDVTSSLTIADQISKLNQGLETISNELQSRVREQHGVLITQANHAGNLNEALDTLSEQMNRLQQIGERLKDQIAVPYQKLEVQTKLLSRLHGASHLLRQTDRFLKLYRNLQSTNDQIKIAYILNELDTICDDKEMERLEIIRDERMNVTTIRSRLINLTTKNLVEGLKKEDESLIVKSLQVFSNMQILSTSLKNLIKTFISDIAFNLKECFSGIDLNSLSGTGLSKKKKSHNNSGRPGKVPSLTSSQNFREKLWETLEWLFTDDMFSYCQQVLLLDRLLIESQSVGSDSISDLKLLFWKGCQNMLRESFVNANTAAKQCLQQGLPILLSHFRTLEAKLDGNYSFEESILDSLEAGYLEKAASNLKVHCNRLDIPTAVEIDAYIRAAAIELGSALVDQRLCILIANVVNECNRNIWKKLECNIKLGTDSQQVVDSPNSSQLQNIQQANLIYHHVESIVRMVENLGANFVKTKSARIVLDGLTDGRKLIFSILDQLTNSIISSINIILLSMHREPGLNTNKISLNSVSMYMKELNDFLQRSWQLHLKSFADRESVHKSGVSLAKRCIDLFVRNLAIIRPVSESGRARLQSDCHYLENILHPIVDDLTELGRHYRLLRGMSQLLLKTPEELAKNTDPEGVVPSYIIALLLFGYAGNDFQSPHSAANWSNEKLIQWLDDHTTDHERFELITGAVQKYHNYVRQKNITQYDAVYLIIVKYLDEVYKQ